MSASQVLKLQILHHHIQLRGNFNRLVKSFDGHCIWGVHVDWDRESVWKTGWQRWWLVEHVRGHWLDQICQQDADPRPFSEASSLGRETSVSVAIGLRELGLTSWLTAFPTYALASNSRPQNIKYASQVPPPFQLCHISTPMGAHLQSSLFLPSLLLCCEASPFPASFAAYVTAVKCKREWLCPALAQALCNNSLDLFSSRWPLLISIMTLKMFLKGQTQKLEQKKLLSQLLH